MPKKMTLEEAQRTVETVNKYVAQGFRTDGQTPSAFTEAGRELGLTASGISYRLEAAKRFYGLESGATKRAADLSIPDFPDDDIPAEEIIDQATRRFERLAQSFEAHTWFPVQLSSDMPFGIAWFGDPHLDDNGCNWPMLRRDIKLCAETSGLWGVNVGDTTNNWAGRLVRLYANQDMSVSRARRLAKWFMLESGVRWLLWLLGNHDMWGDGAAVLAEMAKQHGTHRLVLHDWEARFVLKFPSGWDVKIYVAHNFKGTSIYNVMHGPMREGLMGEDADVYVCGDKHVAGKFEWENPAKRKLQNFVRVRGYKFFDDHTRHLGFKEQAGGCSAVTIFDPRDRSVETFLDLAKGVEFLTMLRQRCATSS